MRLWSLHPKYLDAKGLTALWREALLAQKVLRGETRGYRFHPQLVRFRNQLDPLGAIAAYLLPVYEEACRRGYTFNRSKIGTDSFNSVIPVTQGQMRYEWRHLLAKLERRDPAKYQVLVNLEEPLAQPLFWIAPGDVEMWEKPQHPQYLSEN